MYYPGMDCCLQGIGRRDLGSLVRALEFSGLMTLSFSLKSSTTPAPDNGCNDEMRQWLFSVAFRATDGIFFQYEDAFYSWRCAGSHFQERLVWYCLLSRQHHNDWKRHHPANILGEWVWVNNGNIPCIILQTKRNQVQKVKRLEGTDHMKE